jgi:hypothetical protein
MIFLYFLIFSPIWIVPFRKDLYAKRHYYFNPLNEVALLYDSPYALDPLDPLDGAGEEEMSYV